MVVSIGLLGAFLPVMGTNEPQFRFFCFQLLIHLWILLERPEKTTEVHVMVPNFGRKSQISRHHSVLTASLQLARRHQKPRVGLWTPPPNKVIWPIVSKYGIKFCGSILLVCFRIKKHEKWNSSCRLKSGRLGP